MGRRSFMLTGTTQQKFDKIERVLPRIMARMGTKTFGIIPASIGHSYIKEIPSDGQLFKAVFFAGTVKKVLFTIGEMSGNGKPKYTLVIGNESGKQEFSIETKKTVISFDVDKEISDGDVVTLSVTIPEENNKPTVVISDIFISTLMHLKQNMNEVKNVLTDELEKSNQGEETYEGI